MSVGTLFLPHISTHISYGPAFCRFAHDGGEANLESGYVGHILNVRFRPKADINIEPTPRFSMSAFGKADIQFTLMGVRGG